MTCLRKVVSIEVGQNILDAIQSSSEPSVSVTDTASSSSSSSASELASLEMVTISSVAAYNDC